MGRLIDADHVKDFFFSETSGTEDVIRDLMNMMQSTGRKREERQV